MQRGGEVKERQNKLERERERKKENGSEEETMYRRGREGWREDEELLQRVRNRKGGRTREG